ncbi:Uncharacterised protein [Vibrio cholerae]|nr:Uncharacterised protein [Vibrio cholerae]
MLAATSNAGNHHTILPDNCTQNALLNSSCATKNSTKLALW